MSVISKKPILVPKNVDYTRWAVIACDQFTSQLDYWQNLQNFVGTSPSTLHITYPEIYLNDDMEKRIDTINNNMQKYLDSGIFEELNSFVLLEREVEGGKKRLGLMLSVDLDTYDFRRVRTEIRATEDTILERLPVRINIRKNAKIELPHIILLIDDNKKEIIENLYENKENLEKLYDFELNMKGGHLRGYKVDNRDEIIAQLDKLLDKDLQIAKYGVDAGIQFAVGDGNHSMATAKAHWENIKKTLTEEEKLTHPARYALVEVMNIYDEGLIFEPIHRVILTNGEKFAVKLKERLSGEGKLTLVDKNNSYEIACPVSSSQTIHAVQEVIEEELKKGNISVDYVHGVHHLEAVVEESNGLGILMPEFSRNELFSYVVNVGNLPKKAFSIGTAENKKYYVEAKRI